MKKVTQTQTQSILEKGRYRKRLIAELRLGALEGLDWDNLDFFVLGNKSGREGLLFYEDAGQLVVMPYKITRKTANQNGRNEAMICDICNTWQKGERIGLMTIDDPDDRQRMTGHYVCLNLDCSLHVRDLTSQAELSRTQLREHIDVAGRIARLHRNLRAVLAQAQGAGR